MEFTGQELFKQRNFYTQTGNFGVGLICTVDNTTGRYTFGVSGDQFNFEFTLQSGKIFKDALFIHSYQASREFSLEAQISSGSYNIIKDDVFLIGGKPKNTGNFNYFYFNRENAGMGATFNLYVTGDSLPLYTITNHGFLTASGQSGVTGYFINQSNFPINVFDSRADGLQGLLTFDKLQENIVGGVSGSFVYSGDYTQFDLTQPILSTFNTNFNNISTLFYITDLRTYNKFVLFDEINDFSFNITGILNRDLVYANYSGGLITNVFNTNLVFSLKSISGNTGFFTGIWDFMTGIDNNNLVSMKRLGNYNTNTISGSGIFPSNSNINFQLSHTSNSGILDTVLLLISGIDVINPILKTIQI